MNRKKQAIRILACAVCVMVLLGAGILLWKNTAASAPANNEENSMKVDTRENRFLNIAELKNARQLGGYIGADGRPVKDGLLIRTEGLDKLSDAAAADLAKQYAIAYVVDFRMEYERALAADKEIPGATNEWITVYEMDMTDPEIAQLMVKISKAENELQKSVEYAKTGRLATLYTEILLSDRGQKGYARFFEILLNADGPVLWHCTYGKDRTGVAAALLLYALGVDEDTIMEDFLLTNEVYRENITKMEAGLKAAGYDDAVVGEAQAMAGVKGEYLKAAFDAVKKEYGSMENYIRNQLGVSDEALHQLREKYLEK